MCLNVVKAIDDGTIIAWDKAPIHVSGDLNAAPAVSSSSPMAVVKIDPIGETAVQLIKGWNLSFDLIVLVPPSRKRLIYLHDEQLSQQCRGLADTRGHGSEGARGFTYQPMT